MRISKLYLFTLLMSGFSLVSKAQFQAGNVVGLRSNNIYSQTGSVTLLEFTPQGAATGYSVAIPYTKAGNRLTVTGSGNTFEGQLSRSEDGRYLCFVGYDTAQFVPNNATGAWAATKVIARVSFDGKVDLSTRIPASVAYNGTGLRTAVSRDGSAFWIATNNTTPALNKVNYKDTNAVTTITSLSYRSIGLFNNSLYTCANNIATFGKVPDAAATTTSLGTKPASGNGTSFVFLDIDPLVSYNNTGFDVLYITDANTSNTGTGLYKYYWNTSVSPNAWSFANAYDVTGTGNALPAITGTVNALNQPVLYAVQGNAPNNSIISIVDASGRKDTMSAANVTVATVGTAGAAGVFRGVAFAPLSVALPLPVKLAGFTGTINNGKTVLGWTTSSEEDTKEFIVEKALDGTNYSTIKTLAANNNPNGSKYSITDELPKESASYYRLKIVDNNGKFTYSNVVVVRNTKKDKALNIFPNPIQGSTLTVQHPVSTNDNKIMVSSNDGRIVKEVSVVEGASQTSFDVSRLHSGSYVLTFSDGLNKTSASFIK